MEEISYPELLRRLYFHFGIVCDRPDSSNCLKQLAKVDAELYNLLTQWRNALDTHHFLHNDFEFRHKLPDIWQLQSTQMKAVSDEAFRSFARYCAEKQIII